MRKVLIAIVILLLFTGSTYFWFTKGKSDSVKDLEVAAKEIKELSNDVVIQSTDSSTVEPKVYWPLLEETNPDIFAWMCIPNTDISVPLLQEKVLLEYYYLNHNYKQEYSASGSVFTPAEPLGVEDAHLLLFGHRTKNKQVAFSSLFDYFGNEQSCNENPYVYIIYPKTTEKWQVWCACESTETDSVYEIPYVLGSDSYAELLSHITSISSYTIGTPPTNNDKIVVLSTCNGEVGGSERFYVVLKLAE